MARFKLTIEYDGSGLVGWQRQANGLSVQEAIETAAAPLGCRSGALRGAGRTDAGVHATGQVAHLDLEKPYRTDNVRDAINARLKPYPIAILQAEPAGADFDARFSATRRCYVYRIVNRRAPLGLDRGQAWLVKRRLDIGAMRRGAETLLGRHDFTTFRDSECQASSPVRTLERFEVEPEGERILLRVEARSFLHRQVRSMVGSLVQVGLGSWSPEDLRAVLDAKDRSRCGPVAPATGLYLTRVDYDAVAGGEGTARNDSSACARSSGASSAM